LIPYLILRALQIYTREVTLFLKLKIQIAYHIEIELILDFQAIGLK
jgi:hypothetical protein